jgi:hypothetical protein
MIKRPEPYYFVTGSFIFNDMIRSLALFISAALFILAPPVSKKQQLLLLSKKYFPENYTVLKEYDETTINGMAHGDSLREFIPDVSTIVHEGYHHYQGVHSSYYDSSVIYRINDTLSFSVKNFKTFPSIEIDNIVPAATRKKIFRYDTYISAKEKFLVTQQFGILGLLEESVAYYQSFSTEIALFNYYKDYYAWKNPDAWVAYLSNIASYRYAIQEFELFISWYMQYAKKEHPKTYKDIISNAGLKKLFIFLDNANTRLTLLYDQHRAAILKELGDRLQVTGNFIYNTVSHTGKGLYDNEVLEMSSLLKKPEHAILLELKK